MIIGAHSIIYSTDPEADRAFFMGATKPAKRAAKKRPRTAAKKRPKKRR